MIDSSFVEKISSDNNEDVKKAILEIINQEFNGSACFVA